METKDLGLSRVSLAKAGAWATAAHSQPCVYKLLALQLLGFAFHSCFQCIIWLRVAAPHLQSIPKRHSLTKGT